MAEKKKGVRGEFSQDPFFSVSNYFALSLLMIFDFPWLFRSFVWVVYVTVVA